MNRPEKYIKSIQAKAPQEKAYLDRSPQKVGTDKLTVGDERTG